MKKRILSLVLVLVLVISLVPVNVFAEDACTITIHNQPSSVFVRRGGTATFTINASTNRGTLKYIWVDTKKVNIDNLSSITNKISNLINDSSIAGNIEEGILGTNSTLTLENVTENMNVACIMYVFNGLPIIIGFATGKNAYAISDEVTLTLDTTQICQSHSLTTNLSRIDAVEPTCGQEGYYACYVCNVCGEYFADPNGQTRTSLEACKRPKLSTHALVYHAAEPGDCDNKSTPEYWKCADCNKYFTDAEGKHETTLVQLRLDGQRDPNRHVEVEYHAAKDATCDSKGNCEYWYCKGCHEYFLDAACTIMVNDDDVEIARNPRNHTHLVEYAPAEATCTSKGSRGYWYCTGCKDYFSDPAGTREISQNDAETPAIGHNYTWVARSNVDGGIEYHEKICTYCGVVFDSGVHTGGTATCHSKKICEVCGAAYGDIDPLKHGNTELRGVIKASVNTEGYTGDLYCFDCERVVERGHVTPKLCLHTLKGSGVVIHHPYVAPTCSDQLNQHSGNIEYWECTLCHLCWTNELLTDDALIGNANVTLPALPHYLSYSGGGALVANPEVCESKFNDTEHWKVCKYCGEVLNGTKGIHVLTMDIPTCHSSNYCVECGYDVGNFNMSNHTGGTELVNQREPNGVTPGYTGDTKCLGCGQIISSGRNYFDICPAPGCRYNLEKIEEIPVGCSKDGVKEHYKCKLCGHIYADEYGTTPIADASLVIKATGHDLHPTLENMEKLLSTDTITKILTSKGFLGLISGLFDKTGKMDIETALGYIAVSDIDHCSDDYYHWLGCQRCGKTLRELAPELGATDLKLNTRLLEMSDRQPHACDEGGAATCQERAKCAECGDYYGTIAPHDFYDNNTCKHCGLKVKGCSAPTLKYDMDVKTGVITLKWNEVTDAKRYEVYCSKTKNGSFDLIYEGEDLSYTVDLSGYGKSYYYKVRAIGTDMSFGAFCDAKYIASKCIAPTVKSSNVSSSGKVKLTWDKVPGAVKYEIWRATSKSGTYSRMYTTTSTSYTNSNSEAGRSYYYKVRAVGTDGVNGPYSDIVSRTCDCGRPVVTAGNDSTSGKITLKWSAISGADKYEIWRATSKSGTYKKLYTTTKTSYTNTSAVPGKTYYYKVKAITSKSSYADSVFSTAVSKCCDCAKPTNVRIGISGTHPYIKWDPVEGADRYAVYRSTSKNGTYTKMYTTTRNYYTNTSALSKTMYYYKVVAISDKSSYANSAYSSIVNIRSW